MPKGAGPMRERVAFDQQVRVADDLGGETVTWQQVHACAAEFRYQRGGESIEAGGLTGQATFKVRVRSCVATRALSQEDRLRDERRSVAYNIREIDAVSDPAHVWLVAESGVAI